MKEVPEYIFKLSPSIAFSISKAMRFLLLGALFFIGAFWFNWLVLGSTLCFGIAWYQFLSNQNICYYLTQEVFKIRSGLFSLQTHQIELFRVKDYVVNQPFLMRVFNIMTIQLFTTDVNSKVIHLAGIPFSNLADDIRDLVLEARVKNRIFELN